jgi:hypothetical protein
VREAAHTVDPDDSQEDFPTFVFEAICIPSAARVLCESQIVANVLLHVSLL